MMQQRRPQTPVRLALALLAAAVWLTGCDREAAHVIPARARAAVAPRHVQLSAVIPSELLLEPEGGVGPLTRLIDRAQRQIFVEDYILTERHVVRALERAEAQGVRVYVLLEPHPLGMGTQPQRMGNELRAAGISVRWTWDRYALTHTKLLVLDDRIAIVSTANLSRTGFTRNREALVVDQNRSDVRALSGLFRADWDHLPDRFLSSHLVVSPENARGAISGLIRAAHHSLSIYAEELQDQGVAALLRRAAEGGVRVRVLLPAPPVTGVPRGTSIRILNSPYIHAKVILVDGRVAFLGSENLSAQSLDRNREVGLLIHGRSVRRLLRAFDRDWRRSHRL